MALADLYTKLIVSDEVRGRIPEQPTAAQIIASPLPAVSGAPILPIIQLTTTAGYGGRGARAQHAHRRRAARAARRSARRKPTSRPRRAFRSPPSTPRRRAPSRASPSHAASILALLLCLIGTLAITHLLETLRTRREGDSLEDVDPTGCSTRTPTRRRTQRRSSGEARNRPARASGAVRTGDPSGPRGHGRPGRHRGPTAGRAPALDLPRRSRCSLIGALLVVRRPGEPRARRRRRRARARLLPARAARLAHAARG